MQGCWISAFFSFAAQKVSTMVILTLSMGFIVYKLVVFRGWDDTVGLTVLYVSAISTLLELNGICRTTYTTLDPDVELTEPFKKEVSGKGKPPFRYLELMWHLSIIT